MGGRGSSSSSSSIYSSGRPRTGQTMILSFIRNTQPSQAPRGMDFGQNLEPSGEYMNVSPTWDFTEHQIPNGWVAGYIEFDNPLVLEHVNTASSGWKKTLSDMYGGKTGKSLSNAVKRDGYDAIVTIDSYYGDKSGEWFNEVVNLNGKRIDKDKFKSR